LTGEAMLEDDKADFFVSHTAADETWAKWIAWQLEAHGFRVFTHIWDPRQKSAFLSELKLGSVVAVNTVALLSASCDASEFWRLPQYLLFPRDEVSRKPTLIGVRVGVFDWSAVLSSIVYTDLVGRGRADAIRALIQGVQREQRERDPSSTSPRLVVLPPAGAEPPFPGSEAAARPEWVERNVTRFERPHERVDPKRVIGGAATERSGRIEEDKRAVEGGEALMEAERAASRKAAEVRLAEERRREILAIERADEAKRIEVKRGEQAGQARARIEAARIEAQRMEARMEAARRTESSRIEDSRIEDQRVAAARVAEQARARIEAARIEAQRMEARMEAARRTESSRIDAQRMEAEHVLRRIEDSRVVKGNDQGATERARRDERAHLGGESAGRMPDDARVLFEGPLTVNRSAERPVQSAGSADGSEPVDVAVFCPSAVARGSVFLVQAFLYPPPDEATVSAEACMADSTAERRGTVSLPLDLPHGTRVDLHLEMAGLTTSEPDATIVWRGRAVAAQFDVSVPNAATGAQAIGRLRIAVEGVPTATLRFVVALAPADMPPAPPEVRQLYASRYRRAFVSYSSTDRAEVLRRVQAFKIAGISVFQDVLDLEPGDRWERALYCRIDECDVFYLFWSRAAAESIWVGKEIAYALKRKGGEEENPPHIQPVPIEGPPIFPPPASLSALHFNDALLAHIHAAESVGRS
jgi:hypothetical protein